MSSYESITVTIRIQPLQTGYHAIPLRLVNESYCKEDGCITIMTVRKLILYFNRLLRKLLNSRISSSLKHQASQLIEVMLLLTLVDVLKEKRFVKNSSLPMSQNMMSMFDQDQVVKMRFVI